MINRRKYERITPNKSILVKEDTGEIINYYHLKDISAGGMYLLKKITSKSESVSHFTFMLPDLMDHVIIGEVVQTRLDNTGTYGTAIKFREPKEIEAVLGLVRSV